MNKIVTVTDGVANVSPNVLTEYILFTMAIIFCSLVGIIIVNIAFRLIIRKSRGAISSPSEIRETKKAYEKMYYDSHNKNTINSNYGRSHRW